MEEQQPSGDPVPETKSMKTGIIIVIILIVAALLFAFWGGKDKNNENEGTDSIMNTQEESTVPQSENNESTESAVNTSTELNATTPESATNPIKVFVVSSNNFKYDLTEMKVKKGDMVKITYTNTQGTHDFVLDEFKVNSGIVPVGETKTLEFIADKTGTFEYYCSVGSHRQMGMVGKLIIE